MHYQIPNVRTGIDGQVLISLYRPLRHQHYLLKERLSQALVAHPCDPSYSKGGYQEDCGSKTAWANSW
jgi:hypothetical protein